MPTLPEVKLQVLHLIIHELQTAFIFFIFGLFLHLSFELLLFSLEEVLFQVGFEHLIARVVFAEGEHSFEPVMLREIWDQLWKLQGFEVLRYKIIKQDFFLLLCYRQISLRLLFRDFPCLFRLKGAEDLGIGFLGSFVAVVLHMLSKLESAWFLVLSVHDAISVFGEERMVVDQKLFFVFHALFSVYIRLGVFYMSDDFPNMILILLGLVDFDRVLLLCLFL